MAIIILKGVKHVSTNFIRILPDILLDLMWWFNNKCLYSCENLTSKLSWEFHKKEQDDQVRRLIFETSVRVYYTLVEL